MLLVEGGQLPEETSPVFVVDADGGPFAGKIP